MKQAWTCPGKPFRHALLPATKAVLKAWLGECPGAPSDPLFPTITGTRLSRDAIERRLAHHVALARTTCPSLRTKRVSMHTLRHTAAMRLLLAGNDITVIALWLGQEQIATTKIYLHADMSHKQRAIHRTRPLEAGRAATGPPIPSWPSWRPCDYADIPRCRGLIGAMMIDHLQAARERYRVMPSFGNGRAAITRMM